MAKERNSWVSTYAQSEDGFKLTITEYGETAEEALNVLLELIDGIGAVPFIDRNNVYTKEPVLGEPSEQVVAHAFLSEAVVLEDGTNYLGIKPGKVEDINENDSYHVIVDSYSYDGTWVNFYCGQQDGAGYYYAHKKSADIFNGMFGWTPIVADKAPLDSLKLYIVGVKGKKTEDIYQNIKKVEIA